MLLYLIRHAEAADIVPDEARPLTAHGRHQVASLAQFLQRSEDFRPAVVWHSPLVRARETAQLLLRELSLSTPLREVPNITPDDDPRELMPTLSAHLPPLAVVGHEPYLSALASLLVAGTTYPVVFAMKKGAVLALERGPNNRWIVRWHVEPDLFA